ncbi:hypothetical protein SNE40_012238 [Patella caerulea]|uniref:UBA domain-containing protein n=1 Tax=Patella caerulea TaxID=87958 RepID=A0AAN8Q0E1_PATCE
MSAAVSTSRATSRISRDKLSSRQTQQTNRHNEGGGTGLVPKDKYQPTQEQINIAQITNINNDDEVKKIEQLMEMTGKNEDQVALALLDCEDDLERAALMLLESNIDIDQGEWKSQGKKKKPKNPGPPPAPSKNENTQNMTSDKSEMKRDRSRDRENDSSDRYDGPSRRGRRNGAPPPRFARGRGRDRNFYGGDRNENGDENRENGFDNRERSGDRGRGRGRGGFGRRGRGRGGRAGGDFGADFGGEFNSEKPAKFEKGPQIDTWTNETAEISQKEPAGWGQTWGAEDWSDDTWTGNLKETQVFTASSVTSTDPEPITTPRNDSNSLGQRLDIGMLLQKPNEIPQQNKQAYNLSQYNQQATESIKNCIGIGAPRPQTISNLQSNQSQSLGPVGSISQSVQSNSLPSPSQSLPGQTSLQQRPKIPRSKLPPPSKIPASAVEMPGHRMPMLDVQFGVDFGNEPAALSFGSAENTVNSRLPTTVTNSQSSSLTNHLPQMNSASNPPESMTSSIMASPPAGSNSAVMTGLDQSSRTSNMYQNTAYSSPPKNDTQSVLNQNKITPPDPIPYSTNDRKSSPLVSQRQGPPTANSIGQGSLSSSNPDTSNLSSFAQGSANYQPTGYQGHKTSALPGSQAYTHTTSAQSVTYQSPYETSQNQYPSSSNQYQSSAQNQFQSGQSAYQSSQNQYSSGQNQYQNGQSQFPSGQTSYTNYQSGSSFQNQSGYSSTSNQSNSSSLYQNSSQGNNAYAGQTNSYHMRDTQSSSSNPTNSNQYQTQSPVLSTSPAPNQSGYSAPTTQVGVAQGSYSAQPQQTQGGYNAQPTPSQTSYSAQSYSSSSALQTSPLTSSKLGDSLTKMSLKDTAMDSHTPSQYEHSSSTTPGLTATTSTPSLSGASVNTVSTTSVTAAMITTTSSRISSISSNSSLNSITTSKAPPNLPPGVPLVGTPQYIMGQAGSVPSFYSLQPPLYGYEDQMQLLQQRVPLANNYYDMAATYQVPSSMSGRDQATLGNVSYSADSTKLNRVDAQSPNPSTQQPTSQSAHQPFIHFNYGYYYPQVLPGTAGFQIPTMYPMPTVTNTPHASTTATTQFQKTYASHGYGTKGYDDLSQVQDYAKTAYGVTQAQTKVSAGTRTAADLAGSSYTKSHSQAFDKQGFHAGTPPPFMPHGTANQTGPMGTPTNPYAAAAPFVQMMTPHNQMLHHAMQQDSSVSNRMSQTSSQSKTGGSKAYGGAYWGTS